jgi:hypothetical protein
VVRGDRRKPPGFEVGFVDPQDGQVRAPLSDAAAMGVRADRAGAVVPVASGAAQVRGFYYVATVDAHVVCESWLERNTAMALDFVIRP